MGEQDLREFTRWGLGMCLNPSTAWKLWYYSALLSLSLYLYLNSAPSQKIILGAMKSHMIEFPSL